MFLVPVLALCSRLSERETGEKKEGGEGRKEMREGRRKDERSTQKEGSCCLWDSLKQEQGTKFVGPVLGGVGSQKSRN